VLQLKSIRELHLDRNNISELGDLSPLRNLTKLNLEGNQIGTVDGLHACPRLQSLTLARQKLPAGVGLSFSDETLMGLRRSLVKLDISDCNLESLEQVGLLINLEELVAIRNNLASLPDAVGAVAEMGNLRSLDLRENPVCKHRRYRIGIYTYSSYRLGEFEQSHVWSEM